MAFTQAYIESVAPPQYQGNQVYLSWTGDPPTGSWYQVYVNESLAWWGQQTSCWLPVPVGPVHIDIGSVDSGEEQTSFETSLPTTTPPRRAELQWTGGAFESTTLAGFYVYGSPTPGAAVSYTNLLATITAFVGGIATTGWNVGGYSVGGYGNASGSYEFISESLAGGVWQFAIVPFDEAGNTGTPDVTSVTIVAPPQEPPIFADGTRLDYVVLGYSEAALYGVGGYSDPAVELLWNASSY